MTNPPLAELSNRALVRMLKWRPPPLTAPLGALEAVQAWVDAFEVAPGTVDGPEASDVYRHFSEWCKTRGHRATSHQWFLWYLRKRCGVRKTRRFGFSREWRPYTFNAATAEYLNEWVKEHPRPIGRTLQHVYKSKIELALNAMGISNV